MDTTDSSLPSRVARFTDAILPLLLAGVAFILGCQELFDADVWWHLRSGRWILEHGRVPDLDPFTFASADRPWIDLQWLFQVALAGAFAVGGVRGMILVASGVCASAVLVAATACRSRWPRWVVVACWLPATVAMSTRFGPRPEVFSLLGVAAYLAVLLRADEVPSLAWRLAPIQVLWVNLHGLFVLGPLILGLYLADRFVCSLLGSRPSHGISPARWWVHLGGAATAVGIACLVNPYGLRGAALPVELFPKITAWGGPYKSYIAEFMNLQTFVQRLVWRRPRAISISGPSASCSGRCP
jgi:hypothetical protein